MDAFHYEIGKMNPTLVMYVRFFFLVILFAAVSRYATSEKKEVSFFSLESVIIVDVQFLNNTRLSEPTHLLTCI